MREREREREREEGEVKIDHEALGVHMICIFIKRLKIVHTKP
jgi:hypothetical protein